MKNRMTATLAVALLAGAASAQSTVAQWNLQNTLGSQATQAGIGSTNVTASNLARGAGLTANAGNNSFNSRGWNDVAANDFVSLGFTVDAGKLIDLAFLYIGTRSSATGPKNLGLFYSVDGFSSALHTFDQPSEAFVNTQVDLTGLANVGGAVKFRILALDNVAAGGGTVTSAGTFRVGAFFSGGVFNRNLQFAGSNPFNVPTPGALALLGVGGLVAARRRRA
ncbi:MAG TPA: hypothetical protein DEB06_05700 [Phycisphaerales bacterium]|nr:hypothetical protein [Phycisphaerales bacterium]